MEFLERVKWTNELPSIYVNIYYEYQRSGADMQYRVKLVVEPVTGQSYFGYPIYAKITMDGSEKVTQTLKNASPSTWSSNIEWTSNWYTISNKTTGSTSLAVRIYSSSAGERDATYPYGMYVAPAYTSVTSYQYSNLTETSVTINWKTAHTCSAIRYGTGTGSGQYTTITNLNTNSGTFTLNNLDPDTDYTIYFMPQRKDSSLWGDGNANTWKSTPIKTYNYPYFASGSTYVIKENKALALAINNPLSKEITLTIMGEDNTIIREETGNIGSYMTTFDATERDLWYSSIPNKASGTYKIKVENEVGVYISNGNIYSANESDCTPIFSDFDYEDTNATTVALTGNSSILVKGYSNVKATVTPQNKAQGVNYADIKEYELKVGDYNDIQPYSDNSNVEMNVSNVTVGDIYVYARDYRDFVKIISKQATLKEYTNIQKGNISIERQDNVGEAVTLSFNGSFWNDTFGSTTNSITNVRYRYKKTTDSDWPSTWNGTTPIAPTMSGNNYSFTGGIAGDTTQLGFDAGSSYNIEVEVFDELTSTTFSVTLGSGTPNMAFVEGGVSLLAKYDETDTTNKVQINGVTKISGNTNITGNVSATGNVEGGSLFGKPWNFNTENTTDTWVPVASGGEWKHRVIPAIDTATSTTSTNLITNKAITNYVNNKLKWTLVKEVSGQTVINLPSSWNEIMIVSWMNNDTWKGMTITIPYGAPSGINYRLSYYGNASDNANVGYYYGNNQVYLGWYNLNGGSSATLSQCKTKVYYR